LIVLCVAEDDASLRALKMATVSAGWELATGATDERRALDQIDVERPHVLVAFGPYEGLVAIVRKRFPGMRIVTDCDTPGATVVSTSLEEVRGVVLDLPRPGGPVLGV
jgi:hypothetical protein